MYPQPEMPALPSAAQKVGDAPVAGAFDIVVMAASLGGPEAVREIICGLPAWFPTPVIVVQHRTDRAEQLTVNLLRRWAHLDVALAQPGGRPSPGTVHIAPATAQLTLAPDGTFVYGRAVGRPGCSADPLFTSAAQWYDSHAIGVVLSGTNADGAAGAVALKRAGGRVLVQNRASARCYAMPAAALATGCVDLVLPVERIAPALVSLVLWPGAADLLRVPMSPWAALDLAPGAPLT